MKPLALVTIFWVAAIGWLYAQTPNHHTTHYEAEIRELLDAMTLEEKIGQLTQISNHFDITGPPPDEGENKIRYDLLSKGLLGAMLNITGVEHTRAIQEMHLNANRHGIPLLFGLDALHGYETLFPVPIAEASSWDLEAISNSARITARESASAGVHWTFAPMVDVSRDARWGRIMEGAGEDPFLNAQVAAAKVKGFQGDDLSANTTIAACAKHFAGYGFAEAGRDYNTVDMSRQTLHNVVLPPFKACVDAGVATFMGGYHELNGVPVTTHTYLLQEVLREDWGFEGFVVSDYNSVKEIASHGQAADLSGSAALSIQAGSDMDMGSLTYHYHLQELVASGQLDESVIDQAVARILRVKFELGLFDDPYRYCDAEREKRWLSASEHQEAARLVARQSIVLLKNEKEVLPLPQQKRIALIGPLIKDKDNPLGSWRARGIDSSAVSIWEGLQAAWPDARWSYAKGCGITTGARSFRDRLTIDYDTSGFAEARRVAAEADLVVLALGEDCFMSAEARSRVHLDLPGVQQQLLEAVYEVNPNIVLVLMNGRPLDLSWMDERIPAIVETWFLGSQSGHAIADVLTGAYNPSGKLPVCFPRSVGQLPLYYSQKNTGRPGDENHPHIFWSGYIDERTDALYPFGYGLSYTEFTISDLKLNTSTLTPGEALTVSLTLTNTGNRAGHEVVQLYTRDHTGSSTRPVRELKRFQKVFLEPGQRRKITFELTEADLAFYTASGEWEAEPGRFSVFAGNSSKADLEAEFELAAPR
jgi:beta-glucosidase